RQPRVYRAGAAVRRAAVSAAGGRRAAAAGARLLPADERGGTGGLGRLLGQTVPERVPWVATLAVTVVRRYDEGGGQELEGNFRHDQPMPQADCAICDGRVYCGRGIRSSGPRPGRRGRKNRVAALQGNAQGR